MYENIKLVKITMDQSGMRETKEKFHECRVEVGGGFDLVDLASGGVQRLVRKTEDSGWGWQDRRKGKG